MLVYLQIIPAMRHTILLFILYSLIASSCLQNVEDITITDTVSEISYSQDIQPIFNSNCTSCHGSVRNGNLAMRNYNELMSGSGIRYGTDLIIPGNASESGLIDSVEPNPESGIMRMPQGGPYLTPNQIQLIRTWINEGALNN